MMPSSELAKPANRGEDDSLKKALRKIPIFADLSDEQLDWFVSKSEEVRCASGEIVIHAGEPADVLVVLVEGEMRGRRGGSGADSPIYIVHAGQVTGMLPFSRLTVFPASFHAFGPTRLVLSLIHI